MKRGKADVAESTWACGRCWIRGDADSVEVCSATVVDDICALLEANPSVEAGDLASEVEGLISHPIARVRDLDANYQRGYTAGYRAGRRTPTEENDGR